MEQHEFDPECPHCGPGILDAHTGKPLPPDHPAMIVVMEVWKTCSIESRKAFHDVCCGMDTSNEARKKAEEVVGKIHALMTVSKEPAN